MPEYELATRAVVFERNSSGRVSLSASTQIRSPSTDLDAQLRVDFGGPKNRGLTNIHAIARAIGTKHQIPIQSLLQIASASSERTVKRVHTLAGFACRIQASPSNPNALAILLPPCRRLLAVKQAPEPRFVGRSGKGHDSKEARNEGSHER